MNPPFFPSFYGLCASRLGHKLEREKTWSITFIRTEKKSLARGIFTLDMQNMKTESKNKYNLKIAWVALLPRSYMIGSSTFQWTKAMPLAIKQKQLYTMTTYRITRAITQRSLPFFLSPTPVPPATYLAVTLVEIPVHRWTLKVMFIIPYTVLASHQQMLELLSFLKVFPAWDEKKMNFFKLQLKLPWTNVSRGWRPPISGLLVTCMIPVNTH